MRFSQQEMARRYGLARGLMDRLELEALVLFGNSGVNRHNNVNPFWLSQYLDMHHCYLVVPRAEDVDAALLVGLTNHVPNAREVSDVPTIEWGGYDPMEKVVPLVRGARRVGLVGVNATFSMGMPYAHHRRLADAVPELVDLTARFQRLRLVKSDEEIEWLRRAAALLRGARRVGLVGINAKFQVGMP